MGYIYILKIVYIYIPNNRSIQAFDRPTQVSRESMRSCDPHAWAQVCGVVVTNTSIMHLLNTFNTAVNVKLFHITTIAVHPNMTHECCFM